MKLLTKIVGSGDDDVILDLNKTEKVCLFYNIQPSAFGLAGALVLLCWCTVLAKLGACILTNPLQLKSGN